MSAIEAFMNETEVESQIENLRRRCDLALQRRLSNPDSWSPAALIKVLFPVIEKYLSAGLTLEEIAKTLRDEGFSITKGHLVRHLGAIRAENGLPPIKRGKKSHESVQAPSARREEQKEVSAARPAVARLEAAPAHKTATEAPVQAFSYEIARPEDGARAFDQELTEEKKIDLIIKTIPPADQEWPELVDFRLVDDGAGKKRDVLELYEEKPDDLIINRRHQLYLNRRRYLMQEYGLGIILESGGFKSRHTLAEKPPITVDLDDLLRRIGIDGGKLAALKK